MSVRKVGGQAVIEGVMMRSPKSFAVAVRRADGAIAVREEPWRSIQERFPILRKPFFRGMVMLFEAMYNGMSALSFSADQAARGMAPSQDGANADAPLTAAETPAPEDESPVLGSTAIALTMAVSMLFAIGLFKFLPHLTTVGIAWLTGRDIPINGVAFHLIDGTVKLLIFLGYIWLVGKMKDMRRVFQYHGAEHKVIACYEAGLPLTVDNARGMARFHPRCGTSFIVVVLMVAIILFAGVFHFLPSFSDHKAVNIILQMFIKVPLMLPVAGLAYELIRLGDRPRAPRWLRLLTLPGLWTQRLTTAEPDDGMLEVALVSLHTALAREDAVAAGVEATLPALRSVRVIAGMEEAFPA